jgi:hypothetical protein
MNHPRGPRNPKRARTEYTIERGADRPRMALKFADELRSIMAALGGDAPPDDAPVTLLERAGRCFFGVAGHGVFTWSDGIAWKVHEAHGGERYEGWRDGRRIGNVDPPDQTKSVWN